MAGDRRLKRRRSARQRARLRVALGPIDVAGLASTLADELSALGADVDVVLSQGSFAFPTHRVVKGRVPRALY
ncbi:MAG: hypothetical protein M3321_10725, partial [Actinomycetota bacterium]|nr:hypothetical protein [Actinomycetota bacterium]